MMAAPAGLLALSLAAATVTIPVCGAYSEGPKKNKRRLNQSRWEEFERLAQDHNSPCVVGTNSTTWSCVRHVSEVELEQRPQTLYGFQKGETGGGNPYAVGATADQIHMGQQKHIVNVTDYDGGFMKMQMTAHMKSLLYPWYQDQLHACLNGTRRTVTPSNVGFFSNARHRHLELNKFTDVKSGIVSEMQQVMEWWAKQPLEHAQTFGLRIYRRGSMLINHLDKHDTHVASAILHVGAEADVGWPLEVIHPHRPGLVEVYVQPGEMVLYEGARIVHGRPMRFRGDIFANIFSHFKPPGWKGRSAWVNPHFGRGLEAPPKQNLEL